MRSAVRAWQHNHQANQPGAAIARSAREESFQMDFKTLEAASFNNARPITSESRGCAVQQVSGRLVHFPAAHLKRRKRRTAAPGTSPPLANNAPRCGELLQLRPRARPARQMRRQMRCSAPGAINKSSCKVAQLVFPWSRGGSGLEEKGASGHARGGIRRSPLRASPAGGAGEGRAGAQRNVTYVC